MPKFINVYNKFKNEQEKNKKELDESRLKLNQLLEKEKDPNFDLSIEHINLKTDLQLKNLRYNNLKENLYDKKFLYLFTKIINKLSEAKYEKHKNDIINFIEKNYDPNLKNLTNNPEISKLVKISYKKFEDLRLSEWIVFLNPLFFQKNQDLMIKNFTSMFLPEELDEIAADFSNYIPTAIKPKKVHTFSNLIEQTKETIKNKKNNQTLIKTLDRLNNLEVTTKSNKNYVMSESLADKVKSSRLRDFALLKAQEIGIKDEVQFDGVNFKLKDTIYENQECITTLKSIKFEVSDKLKKHIILLYHLMDQRGLIDSQMASEQGVKSYAFNSFDKIRNKVEIKLKNDKFSNPKEIFEFKIDVDEYEYKLSNLLSTYANIKYLFPVLNELTVPGNMSNFRNSSVPFELKQDEFINATLNGFAVTFSALKANDIKISDFLNNPSKYYFELLNKELGKDVDDVYNNDDIDLKFTKLFFPESNKVNAIYRYLENLLVHETDEECLKNNSLAYALDTSYLHDNIVCNYRQPYYFFSATTEGKSHKTVLNYLLAKEDLKNGKYKFSDIYGYPSISLDGFKKEEPKFNTKDYIKEHNITVEEFYQRVINQITYAYQHRDIKNKQNNNLVNHNNIMYLYNSLCNAIIDFVELNQNIKYNELEKLVKFIADPKDVLKDIIDDDKFINVIDAMKKDEILLKLAFNIGRINDILASNKLSLVTKDNLIFKMYQEKIINLGNDKNLVISKDETVALIKELIYLNNRDNKLSFDEYLLIIQNINKFYLTNYGVDIKLEIDELDIDTKSQLENQLFIENKEKKLNLLIEKHALTLKLNKNSIEKIIDDSFKQLVSDYRQNQNLDFDKEINKIVEAIGKNIIKLAKENDIDVDFSDINKMNTEISKIVFEKYFGQNFVNENYDLENLATAFISNSNSIINEEYMNPYLEQIYNEKVINNFSNKYGLKLDFTSFMNLVNTSLDNKDKFYLESFRKLFDVIRKEYYARDIFKLNGYTLNVDFIKEFDDDINKCINAIYSQNGVKDEVITSPLLNQTEKERICFLESLFHIKRFIDVKNQKGISYKNVRESNLYSLSHVEKTNILNEAYQKIMDGINKIKDYKLDNEGRNVFLITFKEAYLTMRKIHNEKWGYRLLRHIVDFTSEKNKINEVETSLARLFNVPKEDITNIINDKDSNFYGNDNGENINEFKNNHENNYKTYSYNQAVEITNFINNVNESYKKENLQEISKFDVILRGKTKNDYIFVQKDYDLKKLDKIAKENNFDNESQQFEKENDIYNLADLFEPEDAIENNFEDGKEFNINTNRVQINVDFNEKINNNNSITINNFIHEKKIEKENSKY